MRINMSKSEIGRMAVNNTVLIEYQTDNGKSNFFIQSGIAGFYASEPELRDLFGLLSYYYNLDTVNNTVISVN